MAEGGQSPNRRGKRVALNSMSLEAEDGNSPESGLTNETILWERFENMAFAVTKLYKSPNWPLFQQTAASATEFYKDSVDAQRRGFDSGVAYGRQLLCKELIGWLQSSSHPFLRRDEFVTALLNKTSTSTDNSAACYDSRTSQRYHNVNSSYHNGSGNVANNGNAYHSNVVNNVNHNNSVVNGDELEIFQEALTSPQGLTDFFVQECRRHAKRRTSDDDSPPGPDVWSRKRARRN